MTSRFVILHHQLRDGEHWDLMLEHGGVLLTWQLLTEPVNRDSLPIVARRIGDHRIAYLDYQGPLSGDRGEVRRVDRGPVEIRESTGECCLFSAGGERLSGRFALRRMQDGRWTLDAI